MVISLLFFVKREVLQIYSLCSIVGLEVIECISCLTQDHGGNIVRSGRMEKKMRNPLSIGVFEEDQRLLSLLRKSLSRNNYTISPCSFYGYPLATFLERVSIQWKLTHVSPYDILIVEIASTELVGRTFAALERIAILNSIPIILLTEVISDELKALSASVIILPLSFHRLFPVQNLFAAIEQVTGTSLPLPIPVLHTIIDWQREQYDTTVHLEQVLIDRQYWWLNQRHEWLHLHTTWLNQRDEWLSQKSRLPDPQYEWLNEQHMWVEQQHNEVNQQTKWLHHRQIWLVERQKNLDLLKLHLPFREAQ